MPSTWPNKAGTVDSRIPNLDRAVLLVEHRGHFITDSVPISPVGPQEDRNLRAALLMSLLMHEKEYNGPHKGAPPCRVPLGE